MTRLRYDEADLLRSHDYARPQIENGNLMHGGFDVKGKYVSPRLLHREPAVEAWIEALRARGGDLLDADASLLEGIRYPSEAQQKLLIREGLGQTFWNMLTITGQIEGRGRLLAEISFPEFQPYVVEDVSEMGIGHLNRGLLKAHGIDEGGEPERGIGGHDVMWFTLRDLVFGETDFTQPVIPDISRPESQAAEIPGLDSAILRTVYFLANLLMIEFRAERGFAFTQGVLRDPELFTDRRAKAERAAEIVDRIRIDEKLHVRSLRLYLGEICSINFKTDEGPDIPGRKIVDELWGGMVQWATVEQPRLAAERQRKVLTERILSHSGGEGPRILEIFNSLEERR